MDEVRRRCPIVRLHQPTHRSYDQPMGKVKKFDLEDPVPILDDEDAEILAAIDEGVRDAEAGRTVPSEEVRKLLPKWISASSTRKEPQAIWLESSATLPTTTFHIPQGSMTRMSQFSKSATLWVASAAPRS